MNTIVTIHSDKVQSRANDVLKNQYIKEHFSLVNISFYDNGSQSDSAFHAHDNDGWDDCRSSY